MVLADFVDPLRTTFRLPQTGPGQWYGSPYSAGQEPPLRQLSNLPANTLALAGFDPQGKVRHVKADAGSAFLPSLAEAPRSYRWRKEWQISRISVPVRDRSSSRMLLA